MLQRITKDLRHNNVYVSLIQNSEDNPELKTLYKIEELSFICM